LGGVSDYTALVATGLAAAGDEVHVWCPAANGTGPAQPKTQSGPRVFVHRELGNFRISDLRRVNGLLNKFVSPRRLLVQWVPHGYGYRSMNLLFCLWLWLRAVRRHDAVELMVHEPFLPFGGSLKQQGVAAMHRLMTIILLNAADQVWTSTAAWAACLRPYALGRALSFSWLAVTSNIAVSEDAAATGIIRSGYATAGQHIVGHFGSYDRNTNELLLAYLPDILLAQPNRVALLLGQGSESMREELLQRHHELAGRVHATGMLQTTDLSLHLRACDLMLQPYIDGVSSRRSSAMVGLSHSLPIVTTVGELTEPLWIESRAVATSAIGDGSALLESINRLLEDPEERIRLGKAGKALYQDNFDLRHTIEALRNAKRNDGTDSAHSHRHLEPAPDRRY
jgi:glycosyltransferase involved in cell wall biosynthesis